MPYSSGDRLTKRQCFNPHIESAENPFLPRNALISLEHNLPNLYPMNSKQEREKSGASEGARDQT